jgi:hypothetical protein
MGKRPQHLKVELSAINKFGKSYNMRFKFNARMPCQQKEFSRFKDLAWAYMIFFYKNMKNM